MNRTQQAARLALRQRRAALPRATRKYATQPPPPAGQPAPNFKEESGMGGAFMGLIAVTGAGVGAWYYFNQDDATKSKEVQQLKGKASEAGQTARDYSEHVKAAGENEINKLRAQGNETLADARIRAQAESANARDYISEAQRTAEQKYTDAKQFASQAADAAARQYDQTKDAAAAKIDHTRDAASAKIDAAKASAQQQYANARAEAERTYGKVAGSAEDAKRRAEGTYYDAKGQTKEAYHDAKGTAEEKKDEAKAGWFSWLGWGRAKAEDAKEDAKWQKDAIKRDAAEGVEEKSNGLAAWASGKKSETVQEKDANVRRAGSYTSSV